MTLPGERYQRSAKPAIQCARRERGDARRFDGPIERFMVASKSFIMRTVARPMNIKNGNDEAWTLLIATDPASRLDVFRARFRLAEYHHQPEARNIQTHGNHVGRNGHVHVFLHAEGLTKPPLGVRDFVRAYTARQFHDLVGNLAVLKETISFPHTEALCVCGHAVS